MVLRACNTLTSIDIDNAKVEFKDVLLSNIPGNNGFSLSTMALKYIKIIHADPNLLLKCSKMHTKMFNRKVLTQYLTVDELVREFALKDQSLMQTNSQYTRKKSLSS